MKALRHLLARAVQAGLLNGFEVGVAPGNAMVSHLFYADDALIFCDAEEVQIGHLRCVLLCFEAMPELRVNLAKSELIPVGQVARSSVLAAMLGCKVVSLPVTYLGLPLGASFKATGIWEEWWIGCVIGWQDGNVTRQIEKLQRDFLWGDGGEGGHYHLGSWDWIRRSKEQEGLGVRMLVLFNLALLGKWLWRFVEERACLWRRVVVTKFGVVRRMWWCGDLSLEFRFPLIFAIAANSEVLVSAIRVGKGQFRADNDTLVWVCPRAKGIFTVSSFYEALVEDKCVVDGSFVYPWKSVWVSGTPSKVSFFVWTASLGDACGGNVWVGLDSTGVFVCSFAELGRGKGGEEASKGLDSCLALFTLADLAGAK
ncbi:uncharacterized protein LOC114288243 [Camellia sinensis]|uniref:uncharacterized protein LOC114288243 n=1 Tax=Camellia sinensis TaxID=4442 RepID=UPI001036BC63|nr:uncharacterized protein LOC114288243 [Camellia sinensis]